MRSGQPDVSVVVPCRNEAPTLRACLEAFVEQDYPRERFEVLLVDGQSTDGGPDFARRAGVRVLADGGRGPAGARNVGIAAARAPIVAFTDADCVPRHDWLSCIAEAFRADPEVAGVAGSMRLPRGTLLGRMEDNDARVFYRGYITSNVAYRRDVLLEVGGFDERLLCAEDYDLAWRVLDAGHRIVHDPRAQVLHAPPELEGGVAGYLRKQLWYARHDVPTHALALRRAAGARARSRGSMGAVAGGLQALRAALWTGAVAGGALARSPAAIALGLAGATVEAGRRVIEAARELDLGWQEAPAMVAVNAAKVLARGAGTLVGLADLARPDVRALLTPLDAAAPSARPAEPPCVATPA